MKKFKNRLSLLRSYILKEPLVQGLPVELTIETTAKCNLSCPMCPRNKLHLPPEDMDFGLFRKIIDEASDYLEFVWLHGYGEPLLNPKIFEMIAYCHSKKIPTAISTNATLLDKDVSEKLIRAGLDYIIFSIDAATKQTYEKYRPGAEYDTIVKNVHNFLKIKTTLKAPIICVAQMILLGQSHKEIREFKKLWNVKGLDSVRVKLDEFPVEMVATRKKYLLPCFFLWRGPLFIQYDGKVYPCCWSRDFEPIGDLRKQTLNQIWNSKKMMWMRKLHIEGNGSDIACCNCCCVPKPSWPFNTAIFLLDDFKARKSIPFFERLFIFNKIPFLKR